MGHEARIEACMYVYIIYIIHIYTYMYVHIYIYMFMYMIVYLFYCILLIISYCVPKGSLFLYSNHNTTYSNELVLEALILV